MYESDWDEAKVPLAYLITFRTYGTWLHGDERGSVDVHDGGNIYGAPKMPANQNLASNMKERLVSKPVLLSERQREIVHAAIVETCQFRGYLLRAANVRSNHAHVVVSALVAPEVIADSLKRYATRRLREAAEFGPDAKIWSRGRSRKYLWKNRHVVGAVDYVLYSQGNIPFTITDLDEEPGA